MRKTWIQIDGVLYEKGTEPDRRSLSPQVMPDIQPYQSMVTGEIITSRSKHRQHLKDHGMVEVGNDSSLNKPYRGIPDTNPQQRKEMLIHQVNKFTNKEWQKAGERHRQAVIQYMEKLGKD